MGKISRLLNNVEMFFEDLLLVFISVFTIILAIAALSVLSSGAPSLDSKVETISIIAQASFLAKAEYFAALLMPWIVILAVLLIARELWLIRRRMELTHFAQFYSAKKHPAQKRKK